MNAFHFWKRNEERNAFLKIEERLMLCSKVIFAAFLSQKKLDPWNHSYLIQYMLCVVQLHFIDFDDVDSFFAALKFIW